LILQFTQTFKYSFSTIIMVLSIILSAFAQKKASTKGYQNPIIHADYSDPDVVRVGNDYYMTASSFNHVPGLPVLHSRDLVNWTLKGYALKKLYPEEHFKKVRHGGGVWAPSIRFHQSKFYIYYPDPDFGIYVITAQNINGPWSSPILVESGKGLIDPCPLWDDDGKVYLVHAYAGSRASIKSILVLKEMNKQGTRVIGDPVMIFDGHDMDPTVEGPKIHKRNGYYYVFAPAGGVSTGWQLVLRSRHVFGPYERKMVMHQGKSTINGPHQGAWVDTPSGENWFFHFQDKGAYGRIVHLQPLKWVNDWPVIGEDLDGDGCGEPIYSFGIPKSDRSNKINNIQCNDEFSSTKIGKQWQWQANPEQNWAMATSNGFYRMYSVLDTAQLSDVWNYPNILGQKFPAEEFSATLNIAFKPRFNGEKFGFVLLGTDLAYVSLVKREDGIFIEYRHRMNAEKTCEERILDAHKLSSGSVIVKVDVSSEGKCQFSYSEDSGQNFNNFNQIFTAKPGKWVGAKIGMFMSRNNITNDAGFTDIDWFRVEAR
jgi:beta-xylosidase